MKNRLNYVLCIAGMVLLVILALFLPQIIFTIQDKYHMQYTEAEVRNSIDVSQLNASYEQQLNLRMSNFLEMQGTMVTAIDYEFSEDEELMEVLENCFYQSWFEWLYHSYTMDFIFYDAVWKEIGKVQDCKKYLIHGKDYQDGVALMMWYFDVYLEDFGTRIRLLTDTETDTIYYAKITEQSNFSVDRLKESGLYYWAETVLSYSEYFYTYYEGDWEAFIATDEAYKEAYGLNESTEKTAWDNALKIEQDTNRYALTFPLFYDQLSTEFYAGIRLEEGEYLEVTMGLPIIGEQIPEMIQD